MGLLHLRARWYLAEDGVFVSKDPFPGLPINPVTMNGYNYANQNPINLIDPSGKYAEIDGYLEGIQVAIALPPLAFFLDSSLETFLRGKNIETVTDAIVLGLSVINNLIGNCEKYWTPNVWPRRHYLLYDKQLVYDFAHLQSAEFGTESGGKLFELIPIKGGGGYDLSTNAWDFEIYVSAYAGGIVGLSGHEDILGYAKGTTHGIDAGLSSGPTLKRFAIDVGAGVAINTNSPHDHSVLAFSEFGQQMISGSQVQVTSFTSGVSMGIGPGFGAATGGHAKGAGTLTWGGNTVLNSPITTYKQDPTAENPSLADLSRMSMDIESGIRFQAMETNPGLSYTSYISPVGLAPILLPKRLNAIGNLWDYYLTH